MNTVTHETVSFRANRGGKEATVILATMDLKGWLNIISNSDGRYQEICAHPDDVRALRDELLKLYPLNVFDERAPKVGDMVQLKAGHSNYFKDKYALPLCISQIDAPFDGDILCYVKDARGNNVGAAFSYRFEAYLGAGKTVEVIKHIEVVKPDLKREQEAYERGLRDGKKKPGKWENVAHGLDRVKVEGGYIYQTNNESIAFAPTPENNPIATDTLPRCTFSGNCTAKVVR